MYMYLLKLPAFSLLFLFVGMFCLPQAVYAQSKAEIKVLRLFFTEEDLIVQSPTRSSKPISQVAENIVVINSNDIEQMNAHSVAEVLQRVPGLFVDWNKDFGATSLIHIQGSEPRHVLVLLDGITWNLLSEGSAETNTIPVAIIDKIEIIKGPASSTWGSSLGGVINIITKKAGNTDKTSSSLSASYGEGYTQDYRFQLSGKAGEVGYYLFGGSQGSDGLRGSRHFENKSFFSKLKIPIAEDTNIGFSLGYSEPDQQIGDFPSNDLKVNGLNRVFFTNVTFDAFITKDLNFTASIYNKNYKFVQNNVALGLGYMGATDELVLENIFDEELTGLNSNFIFKKSIHTAVFGFDFEQGKLCQARKAGQLFQLLGAPSLSETNPEIDKWALYANDTISFDRWSLTGGVRYDYNDITGSFFSPSLGLTLNPSNNFTLRFATAKGFTIPPLSSTSGGGLFADPNPSLKPEEVFSYQFGIESVLANFLWLKGTFFHHNIENSLKLEIGGGGPPNYNDIWVNNGNIQREGCEIELETLPINNFSFFSAMAYVNFNPPSEVGSSNMFNYIFGLKYNDNDSLNAQLFGHKIWWNYDASFNGKYDDFIWDFSLNKKLISSKRNLLEMFFIAHNIFNGSQYTWSDNKNPERWVEIGIRLGFF